MAARLLIALVIALALVSGGYWWGHTATDNAWQAKHANALEAERAETAKETARADLAAASYLTEHLDQEDRYAALHANYQDLRRRAPLVVRPLDAESCTHPDGTREARAGREPSAVPAVASSPVLTLAAVRMWNGALTGADQAAGACGPAGAPESPIAAEAEACAESSGLTLDDAWANHAANAQACAVDRQRYQHLIDFLNGK